VYGDEGAKMVDPAYLQAKWWVQECAVLEDLIINSEPLVNGNERDLLSLRSGLLVSSAGARKMTEFILRSERNQTLQNEYVIDPTYVSEEGLAFVANPNILPQIPHSDLSSAKMYMVSMASSHAWLTVVDKSKKKICFYDSLKSHISNELREEYYFAIVGGCSVCTVKMFSWSLRDF
jgi:hypothetical protein